MNPYTDVVSADEDGLIRLPETYADAKSLVYRDPSKTVDMRSAAGVDRMWFDETEDANPDLSPRDITLKVYGEDAERFFVTLPDDDPNDVPDQLRGSEE